MEKVRQCSECVNHGGFLGVRLICKRCLSLTDRPLYESKNMVTKNISFPILNNLTPTLESCTKKVFEEIGELMQLLGKGQRQSGEYTEDQCAELWAYRVIEEGLDGAQSLVTLINLMIEKHDLELETFTQKHEKKLREKGYLK